MFNSEDKNEENAPCDISRKFTGGLFLVTGFLLAGVMTIVAAAEQGEDAPNAGDMETYMGVAGAGLLLSLIGFFMSEPDTLCSGERSRKYFGNMLILLSFGGVCGFVIGVAMNLNGGTASAIETFAYMTGICFFVLFIGWVLTYYSEMTCDSGKCMPRAAGHYIMTIFSLVAGVFFCLYAHFVNEGKKDEVESMMYVIGAIFILMSIGSVCFAFFN